VQEEFSNKRKPREFASRRPTSQNIPKEVFRLKMKKSRWKLLNIY
jgi:hypothetical protein